MYPSSGNKAFEDKYCLNSSLWLIWHRRLFSMLLRSCLVSKCYYLYVDGDGCCDVDRWISLGHSYEVPLSCLVFSSLAPSKIMVIFLAGYEDHGFCFVLGRRFCMVELP